MFKYLVGLIITWSALSQTNFTSRFQSAASLLHLHTINPARPAATQISTPYTSPGLACSLQNPASTSSLAYGLAPLFNIWTINLFKYQYDNGLKPGIPTWCLHFQQIIYKQSWTNRLIGCSFAAILVVRLALNCYL